MTFFTVNTSEDRHDLSSQYKKEKEIGKNLEKVESVVYNEAHANYGFCVKKKPGEIWLDEYSIYFLRSIYFLTVF